MIEVSTEALRGASGKVGGIASALETTASEVGCASGAAADTDAAGAYEALMTAAARTVGVYAATTNQLATALDAAAQCYELADRLPGPLPGAVG